MLRFSGLRSRPQDEKTSSRPSKWNDKQVPLPANPGLYLLLLSFACARSELYGSSTAP